MHRQVGAVSPLLAKSGQQYSARPLLVNINPDEDKQEIDKVLVRGDHSIAVTVAGDMYMWGDLTRGVSMEVGVDQSDLPRKCENFKCYNFTDMGMTEDTCVGIGRSIMLNFVFPEYNAKKPTPNPGADELNPVTPLNLEETKTGQQPEEEETKQSPDKPQTEKTDNESVSNIQISVHAIPVFDGELIASEEDLAGFFAGDDDKSASSHYFGATCGLLNEFDVPWVERQGLKYPIYRRTLKFPERQKRDSEASEEEDRDEDDDMELDDDESVGGSDDEPMDSEMQSQEMDSDADPDAGGRSSPEGERSSSKLEKDRKKKKDKKDKNATEESPM